MVKLPCCNNETQLEDQQGASDQNSTAGADVELAQIEDKTTESDPTSDEGEYAKKYAESEAKRKIVDRICMVRSVFTVIKSSR